MEPQHKGGGALVFRWNPIIVWYRLWCNFHFLFYLVKTPHPHPHLTMGIPLQSELCSLITLIVSGCIALPLAGHPRHSKVDTVEQSWYIWYHINITWLIRGLWLEILLSDKLLMQSNSGTNFQSWNRAYGATLSFGCINSGWNFAKPCLEVKSCHTQFYFQQGHDNALC